jgi:hypothetical protein
MFGGSKKVVPAGWNDPAPSAAASAPRQQSHFAPAERRERPEPREGRSGARSFSVAVYPIPSNIDEFLKRRLIPAAVKSKPDLQINPIKSKTTESDFFIVDFATKPEAEAIARCPQHGRDVGFASPIDTTNWPAITSAVTEAKASIIQGAVLNLSNAEARGLGAYLANPAHLAFLFFFSAVLCEKASVTITEVRFFNESFAPGPLRGLRACFRNLNKLVLREGSINDGLKAAIEKDNIMVEFVSSDALAAVVEPPIAVGNPWGKFLEAQPFPATIQLFSGPYAYTVSTEALQQTCGLFQKNPIILRQGGYRVRARASDEIFRVFLQAIEQQDVRITAENRDPLLTLCEEFDFVSLKAQLTMPEIRLDRRYPVDAFLLDFLHCSWNALPEVSAFYLPEAVLSISVALHAPDSPLEEFERFSHYTGDDKDGNVLVGRSQIQQGLVEVFGSALMSRPTAVNVGQLGGSVVAIGLHGSIWLVHQWFNFDRTMVVAFVPVEGKMLVANDHLYLREPDLLL